MADSCGSTTLNDPVCVPGTARAPPSRCFTELALHPASALLSSQLPPLLAQCNLASTQIISIISSPTELVSTSTAVCVANADDTAGCGYAFKVSVQPLQGDRYYFLAGEPRRSAAFNRMPAGRAACTVWGGALLPQGLLCCAHSRLESASVHCFSPGQRTASPAAYPVPCLPSSRAQPFSALQWHHTWAMQTPLWTCA